MTSDDHEVSSMTPLSNNPPIPQPGSRVAMITGAGSGIGYAVAMAFARTGTSVFATAKSPGGLSRLKEEAQALRVPVEIAVADLSDPSSPTMLAEVAMRRFGRVDILVNNAGVGSSASLRSVAEFDDEFWNYTLAVNLTAPYLLSKAIIPHMVRQGWGRIINIASLAAKMGLLHGAAYAASKHGLLGLTRTMAIELASRNVTVNAICPGAVRTPPNERRIQHDARRTGMSVEEIERSVNPLGRRLLPEEIAPLTLFLAQDAAGVINGQAYNIDGGACMTG